MFGQKSKASCEVLGNNKLVFGVRNPCRNESEGAEAEHEREDEEPELFQAEEKQQRKVTRSSSELPKLKRQPSFPYFRSCRKDYKHRYQRTDFIPKWPRIFLNTFEREKENLVCVSPEMKDSYEMLCSIPICELKPDPIDTEPGEPFDGIHCVFCDKSLYLEGAIYDLWRKVPAIKRQSTDLGDDIADKIGIRTRITVHKSCFENYIKGTSISQVLDCVSNGSQVEDSPTANIGA